jgi:hypothetical protein
MIAGLFTLIACNAAVILGARRLVEEVRTGKPALDFVIFLLLRTLLISAVVLVAGLSHLLAPLPLGIAGVAALALLFWSGAHRLPWTSDLTPWNPLLVGAAAVLALKVLLQVWFFAPYAGDVLTYHLPKIAEWVRAGAFTRELGLNPRVTLPAGFELLETWWVLFLHHDVLIEMAGVEMLLLASAAVYALAREFRLESSVAFAAALLFAVTPGLQVQATSAMNDIAAVALTLSAAALIVARAGAPRIVMAVALGAGIKATTLYALPGLVLLSVLERREPASPEDRPEVAWGAAAVAALVGGFWYARNLLWFGNPVYPMGTELGRQVQQFGPSLHSLLENLQTLVDVRVYDRFPVGALHAGNANWGAVVFACGAPAMIGWMSEDARARRLGISLGVSLGCVLTLVTMDAWNMRFILFAPALPAIAAARAAAASRLVRVLAAGAALLCVASSILPFELAKPAELARASWRERSTRPGPPDGAASAPIGALGSDLISTYWLYGPDFSRRVVYLREDSSAAGLLQVLDREGLDAFYASSRASEGAAVREAVASKKLAEFHDAMGLGFRRVK